MQTNLDHLLEQFDALALRLRIMLTLAVVVVLFMLFDIFWFSSNNLTIKRAQQKIDNDRQQAINLINLQNEHNEKLFKHRSDPKIKQLNTLNIQLDTVRQQLSEHTLNLVQPEEMANVLKDIILSSKLLKLKKLVKEQSVELSKTAKKDQEDENQQDQIRLYRHSMIIELKGNYRSAFKFLQKLEKMEKQVAFDRFEYIVDVYPKANIKLTVSTLSLDKGWVGG